MYSENFDIWILTIFIIVIPWLPPPSVEVVVLVYKSTSSHDTLKHSVPIKNHSEREYRPTRQHIEQKARNKIEAKQECRIRETRQYTHCNYVLNLIV